MQKDDKVKVTPEIDEELMMAIMEDGVKKEGMQIPDEKAKKPEKVKVIIKERSKVKKINETDYEKIFFKRAETNARNGKSVYIRPDFHEKMSRIVQVIGEDKITIYAYLDNLLEYHFLEFGEQITKSYNDKHKPIF
ncbi:DUF3408 domain-containing protein [Flavobacterium sp. Fl-318]|uniref:DUF3408 domain-containing protein n=1 Tax=Flavobacterium cupriresistens TaxID=2893885 RepID=A0ABU4R5E3_9FLAO|nr:MULTISPECIES: DUF3408 domain-containing protein [unclassified Flavobacterium]MDX6187806.1 DUF3408 domain-containing protein [Flavobacterium sp. Fl-318]UFH42272.1 DUF3408 domain-containing protein [Flavobacterium sp. F-323]